MDIIRGYAWSRPLGTGSVADTPRNTPLPTCVTVTVPNLVVSSYGDTTYKRRSNRKSWASASHLSRLLKVIGTDMNRSGTYVPILCRF